MLKIQLEKRIKELEDQLTRSKNEEEVWEIDDRENRKLISKLLGKYVESFYPTSNKEILEWSEIFFELGRLKERSEADRSFIELQKQVKFLSEIEHNRREKEENAKKQDRREVTE